MIEKNTEFTTGKIQMFYIHHLKAVLGEGTDHKISKLELEKD